MMRANAILSASGLVLALSLPGWAQVQTLPTHTVTLTGTVETIDHAKRVMNIKTADGKFETIDVPAGAKRFDELKVGDKVSVTYNNNVSARLKPPGEADGRYGEQGLNHGAGGAARGHDGRAEDDDRDHQRDRQERIVDHLRWSERMEIQPTCRRSDGARQGQGWRQG